MNPVMQRLCLRPRALVLSAMACLGLGVLTSSAGCNRDQLAKEGRVTQLQLDNYLRDAVHMSSEGIVLEPSAKGLSSIERARLGEIAQDLRRPAAVCFVERAIVTMEAGEVEGETGWIHIPEGQIKIRARTGMDGRVLTTNVLESGFDDPKMEACLKEVLQNQRFPESRDGFAYYVDVYYWVSLGLFREANSESFVHLMRRQQAEAGLRARGCLTGRVPAGTYVVSGLNLFGRDGRTLINRVDRGKLPGEVSRCVASAFKAIHIHAEPDAFVRPAAPIVEFEVSADGQVTLSEERWLEVVKLEERAERERRQAELMGETPEPDGFETDGPVDGPSIADTVVIPSGMSLGPRDFGELPLSDSSDQRDSPDQTDSTDSESPDSGTEPGLDPGTEPVPTAPGADPSKPGVKIDLSPSRAPSRAP